MSMKLPSAYRGWLYGTSSALFVSGVVWAILHRVSLAHQDMTRNWSAALEPWMLKLHGAAAMIFLVVIGALLPIHILKRMATRKNLVSGLVLLGLIGLLTITGYGLYYIGNDTARSFTSLLHLWVGVLAPGILLWHLLYQYRRKKVSRSRLPH